MSENKKVKVRLKVSTPQGKPGDVVEVHPDVAAQMTAKRSIQTFSGEIVHQTAEEVGSEKEEGAHPLSQMTLSQMNSAGLKNVVHSIPIPGTEKADEHKADTLSKIENPEGIQPGGAISTEAKVKEALAPASSASLTKEEDVSSVSGLAKKKK